MITHFFATIAHFLGALYHPSLWLFSAIGIFLSILGVTSVPYFVLGLLTTRKFEPAKHKHKYAILIPGRNEEPVIANLIESIHKQDYPQDLLTIFVVADNCTDHTADVARENGAICYEHFNKEERTKGFALKYLFEQIDKDYGIDSFEGYFIFDADNLLNPDYISRMNDSFDAGEKIITSYRNTKNLSEGWVASLYAIHWLVSVRIKHRPRSILHLATNIQGTGFLFANEIVNDGWKYTSLTEDRALTADCVVNGYQISYNNDAIFYDEQPTSLKVSCRQRLRWAKGHLQAFVESGWGLFTNIFIDRHTKRREKESWLHFVFRSLRHRFMSFDTFGQITPKQLISLFRWLLWSLILYSCYVFTNGGQIHLFGNTTLGSVLQFFFGDVVYTIDKGGNSFFLCLLLVILMRLFFHIGNYISGMFLAIYIFFIERNRIQHISLGKKIIYIISWPIYDVIERIVKIVALFVKVEWKPIPHNSKITIDDLKKEPSR